MTLQELFNKASTRLIAQYCRSTAENGVSCLYFNPFGHSCAVGLLLRDSEALAEKIRRNPEINTMALGSLLGNLPEAAHALGFTADMPLEAYYERLDLLTELQHLHDTKLPMTWLAGLHDLAKDYKLAMPAELLQA